MTTERELIGQDIEAYLRRYQDKELLRFVAVGSVDDGKSTLIGRLLYDTGSVYEDQLAAVRKATTMEGTDIDLSLITDGLAAEREQGITIDVAYRYFTTDKRKFIIADTPGHVQYTRNMVTGASTANVAIILIDARLGVLQQSRRHAYIASLLGIPHLAVCVNKMDLVAFDRSVFERIREEFAGFTKNLSFTDVTFFPISALTGANCVRRSEKTPWYEGPTVLEFLESVPVQEDRNLAHFRYPVQYVLRPNLDYRGFSAKVASGVVKKGDPIMVLPSGKTSRVKGIDTFEGEIEEAFAPQSVTIRLEDEVDVSRGDMLVHPSDLPRVTRTFDAHVVWMHETPLDPGKSYFIKHTTQTVRVNVDQVHWRKDMDTLDEVSTETLALNDIGRVTLTSHRPLFVDAYQSNRETGSFILIDSITNNTVAAGMVIGDERAQDLDAVLRAAHEAGDGIAKSQVSAKERRDRFGQRGASIFVVGREGSGSEALAYAIERRLFDTGRSGAVLVEEAEEPWLAGLAAVAHAGLVGVTATQRLPETARLAARLGDRAIVVHVTTPEAVCKERRPGASFAGYAAPAHADATVDLEGLSFDSATDLVLGALEAKGFFR
ncbi:MAG: sulfate adenylyltransferase subunit CysN [Polyangiales bacterium]